MMRAEEECGEKRQRGVGPCALTVVETCSTVKKKMLGQLRKTLPVCKNQLINAALMAYNN